MDFVEDIRKFLIEIELFRKEILSALGAEFIKGSILFIGDEGIIEDNTNLFWDDTNNRLGIGTSPADTLDVLGNIRVNTSAGDGSRLYLNSDGNTDWAINNFNGDFRIFNGEGGNAPFNIEAGAAANSIHIDSGGLVGIRTNSPVCVLDVNGGFAVNLVTKTGGYTATASDHTILCDASGGDFTITLPAASGVSGIIYNIKSISTGLVTVDGNASETIDGTTTKVISNQYDSITIQCDGSNWHII